MHILIAFKNFGNIFLFIYFYFFPFFSQLTTYTMQADTMPTKLCKILGDFFFVML